MKSNVFALIFVALCTSQIVAGDPLSQLKLTLQRVLNNVNSILSDIKRTTNNLESTVNSQLSNLKTESMSHINGYVNTALDEIRKDVDALKNEGKNVEHCYDDARATLRTISLNGFADLDKCQSAAQQTVQTSLATLQTVEATANQLLGDLNNILSSCYSNNLLQMINCITMKLGTANAAIRTLENNVVSVKRDVDRSVNDAVLSVSSCNFNVTSTVLSSTTDVRLSVNKCLKNL